jgi:hypothetical protein
MDNVKSGYEEQHEETADDLHQDSNSHPHEEWNGSIELDSATPEDSTQIVAPGDNSEEDKDKDDDVDDDHDGSGNMGDDADVDDEDEKFMGDDEILDREGFAEL